MTWEELIRMELKPYAMAPIIRSIWYSQIEEGAPYYRKLLLYIKDNNGYYYENYEDHHLVGEWLIKRILDDPVFWEHHIETWHKKFNEFDCMIAKAKETHLERLSDEELVKLHVKMIDLLMRWHGYAYAVDAIDAVLNEKIKEEIKSALMKKLGVKKAKESLVNRYYSELTTAKELTYISREQILLLGVTLEILKDKELKALFGKDSKDIAEELATGKKQKYIDIKKVFSSIIEKYYWINFTWDVSQMLTEEDLAKNVKEILKEKNTAAEIGLIKQRLENHSLNTTELKEKIISELSLGERFRRYMEIFEAYAVFHDMRKEGQVKGTYFSYLILKEYCSRLKLNFELARNSLPEEIQECMLARDEGSTRTKKKEDEKEKEEEKEMLKKKVKELTEKMKQRKDEVLLIITHDNLEEIYGSKAGAVRDKETSIEIDRKMLEFQGLAANPGRAVGIARVCLGADEANKKIKEGEILVTGMTMPEYVPAMRKAAAIITDEGGLTCHAAIISRELGKPCIVGTKIATRAIKDGSEIEVNANHGIVKILGKAE